MPEPSVVPETVWAFGPVTERTTGSATIGNPDASIAATVKVWTSPTGFPKTLIGVSESDPVGGTPVGFPPAPCVMVSASSPAQHSE